MSGAHKIGRANSRCAHSFVRHWFHNIIGFGERRLPAAVAHLSFGSLIPSAWLPMEIAGISLCVLGWVVAFVGELMILARGQSR